MRKSALLLGCFLMLVGPVWASGGFQLFGTYGEITDHDASVGAGARVTLGFKVVMFDLTGTWLPQQSTSLITDQGAPMTDDLRITPIELGLRLVLAPGADVRPYFGAGASYFMVDLETGVADDEVGYYASAGLIWSGSTRVSDMKFFGEVLYRDATATVSYPEQGAVETPIGGFAVSLGVQFGF
jgi:hypothetical protein